MPLRNVRLVSAMLFIALLAWQGNCIAASKQEQTEKPPVLSAKTLLPAKILSGPNYTVDDKVVNDGYINTYTLHTPKGDLPVESTSLLYTRIKEMHAAAAMDNVNKGAEIGKSIGMSGVNAVKGVFNLVVHPGDTLSGVGKSFSRAQAATQERRPSDDKGTFGELMGFNKAIRDCAKAYDVSPYSRNPILQDSMKRLAGANFFGSFAGTAAIPGGGALAFINNSNIVPKSPVDVTTPPQDLFDANRKRLKAMGVPPNTVELYIENVHFTPIEQTRLVLALDRLQAVGDRPLFINQCVLTDSDAMAWFRTGMAELYANTNATTDKLSRFVKAGKYIAAVTPGNGLVVAYPLDYLAWTPTMAGVAESFASAAKALQVKTKKLIITGEVSPLAARNLKAAGWTVVALRQGLR